MPRLDIHSVGNFWQANKKARSHTKSLRTDGRTLWSYGLVIGYTDENGRKIAYKYMACHGHFRSRTTSRHVSIAMSRADECIMPE